VAAAQGRCIGRSDLRPDPRRVRRLARRIRSTALAAGLPRCVQVSPLARCREVGRALRRLGFECRVVPDLIEADFGRWDGRRWGELPRAEVDAWAADLLAHAPGGGESVAALAQRARAWLALHGALIRLGRGVDGRLRTIRR
jgi:alpha-ribazole phosphatase